MEFFCVESLVPENHLLRKIESAVDFTYIYDLVKGLYSADNGRPSCDPVVLFKMVLIQHLYGIRYLRRTVEEIDMNISYRWFLGYTMSETIPHFATISYNFKHRFTEETIEKIFNWILLEISIEGYLSPEAIFIDGTHIKANANMKKAENSKYEKTVTRHIWSDYLEMAEDVHHTFGMIYLYNKHKETIERIFADAKEKHAMRYTPYRCLSQVSKWVRLKFAAMNLKKFAKHRWEDLRFYCVFVDFLSIFHRAPIYT